VRYHLYSSIAQVATESARKVHVGTIAFRSGGWKDNAPAGTVAIYDGPADLLANFDASPLRHRHASQ
jgi:hypothetical protein